MVLLENLSIGMVQGSLSLVLGLWFSVIRPMQPHKDTEDAMPTAYIPRLHPAMVSHCVKTEGWARQLLRVRSAVSMEQWILHIRAANPPQRITERVRAFYRTRDCIRKTTSPLTAQQRWQTSRSPSNARPAWWSTRDLISRSKSRWSMCRSRVSDRRQRLLRT